MLQMREQVICKLQAIIAREKDPERVKKLKEQLAMLARAELADLKARPAPLYPVGAVGRWDGKSATVTGAVWREGRWWYTVTIDAGAFIPNFNFHGDEAEIARELAARTGNAPGPAYPAGVTFARGKLAAPVRKAEKTNGTYTYEVQGWPRSVTQEELARALARG